MRLHELAAQAMAAGVRAVATGDVLYHAPEARLLQDVVTAIREKCTVDTLGHRRERHADRHLKSPEEMERRFAVFPDAIAATADIARACRFDLGELSYQYPHEEVVEGLTAHGALEQLTREAAERMFPGGVPLPYQKQIAHELRLIGDLGYAPYFLTVNSIVTESRRRGILCQGRGSAANSCVCFVLGVTSIDPIKHELLFERFVSGERREPPDIDVDFEHERREEIIQWIYETYGRDRSALTAVVTRYRARGAVREVGKALGLPEDLTKALAGLVWGWSQEGVGEKQVNELGLNMADRRLRLALDLARKLIGVPRHLSQHPGGFVLTHDRLDDLVPIEPAAMIDRQVIEWDKDDIDALKFMKVDVLGLGMLGCMNRAFKTQPLATVPTFRCNRAIERVGRLCLRHPLPAVVFAEDAPIAAVIQVDDTVTALGFDLPIFLNVVGRQHFGADTVILTGYFFIPVPDVATGDRWNHVIQNSHRNVEGTTLQTSDGEWVIRYEWSAPKRAFSWFRRS